MNYVERKIGHLFLAAAQIAPNWKSGSRDTLREALCYHWLEAKQHVYLRIA